MKNIHLLPTDKPSRLYKDSEKLKLDIDSYGVNNQNIYITSDEEIKVGDWYLNSVIPTNERINKSRGTNVASFYKSKDVRKIILTTDQDLIADGVQAIDDEFLEWFVKNPSCEFVEVKKQYITPLGDVVDFCYDNERLNYKIIIPQEEPKQEFDRSKYIAGIDPIVEETLEEVAERSCESITHPYCDREKSMFIKGAEWKEEQIPSIIEQKWLEYRDNTNNEDAWCFKEWLVEQFKNK